MVLQRLRQAIDTAAHGHREELANLAAYRNWSYVESDPRFVNLWPGHPFDRGHSRRTQNVLQGTVTRYPFVAFDYLYRTESHDSDGGRSTSTSYLSVVALRLPVALPRLAVIENTFFSRFSRFASQNAPSGDPVFDRRFRVQVDDWTTAARLLPPPTRAALLSVPPPLNLRIEGADLLGLVWNDRLRPATLDWRLTCYARLTDALPIF